MLELSLNIQNMYMEISPAFPYQEGELKDVEEDVEIESKYLVRIYFSPDRGDEVAIWFYIRPFQEELGLFPLYCAIPFSPLYSPIMQAVSDPETEGNSNWQKMIKDLIELAEELLQMGESESGKVYRWTRDCL